MALSRADFETWRLLVQPVIWYYEGLGPDWFPGVYLGPGPVRAPNQEMYTLGADIGLGPGVSSLIFDMLNAIRLPSGTIIAIGDTFMDPPAYPAYTNIPCLAIVRSTEDNMFAGVAEGSVGYLNATKAVDATGLGAYTVALTDFGGLGEWSGHTAWFGAMAFTGQNLLILAEEMGTFAYNPPFPVKARLLWSNDDGVTFTQLTTFLDAIPDIENEINAGRGKITRGGSAGGADQITIQGEFGAMVNATGVVSIQQVRLAVSPFTIYTPTTDYILTGNTIDWSPGGAEPAAGAQLTVNFRYNGPPWIVSAIGSDGTGAVYAIVTGNRESTTGVMIIRSLDHGMTWEHRSTVASSPANAPNLNQTLCVLSASELLIGVGNKIRRSTDGGSTWTDVYTHTAFFAAAIKRLRGNVLVASVNTGVSAGSNIIRSTDAGVTWTIVYTSVPRPGFPPPDINGQPGIFQMVGQNEVIALSQFGRMFYSPNLGLTWEAMSVSQQVPTFAFSNSDNLTGAGDNRHALAVTGPDAMIFTNVPTPVKVARAPLSIIKGRTIYVSEVEYQYTHQMNIEDFGGDPEMGAEAGGARELYIQVRQRTVKGQLGEPSVIHVLNPAPDMSGTRVTATSLNGGLEIDWSSYKPVDPDPDHFEVCVGYSNDPLALTKKYRRGKDQNNVFVPGLSAGVTVFFQVVPFDSFGRGIPTAIYSETPS